MSSDKHAVAGYLQNLNKAQLEAVKHAPHIPLQILAGPGSGKTKVLTSRIAYLISQYSLSPESICAVTFTNKAANEMQERLCRLIGKSFATKVKMGTFHALCAMYLRKHATLIGISPNFIVCDAEESKKIVSRLLKPFADYLDDRGITLKEGAVISRISKAKAKGITPKVLLAECTVSTPKASTSTANPLDTLETSQVIENVSAQVYGQYQRALRQNNSLDFDDLLVYGVQLFRDHPKVSKWCRHVLVDEFQDTNTMQYELMACIAKAHRCVSIVGDPDQSIYGWRSAEVGNLARMQRDFAGTRQIYLEQNYRSTGSILAASMAIITQDESRVQKTLHTSHRNGPLPVLHPFSGDQSEAAGIAGEIKKLIAHSGGMLAYNDFAVLLRMNSLSRAIESALQMEGIPHVVLGGHRFFERMEVKDIIAYLQVIDNPQFVPAFARVINVPARSIGEKSVKEILAKASRLERSPLELIEGIHDGRVPDIKPPVKRKVAAFIEAIRSLRKMAIAGEGPGAVIQQLLDLICYEEHLKKHHDDWEARWDNVAELLNFATQFQYESPTPARTRATAGDRDRDGDEWDDTVDDDEERDVDTPLRAFLEASMLATDAETEKDGTTQKDRVTIATCHAAKGLEWPVVFIPAVEKGVFPSSRAEDIDEERRLLYVACTRAQCLLYLSHCTARMTNGTLLQKSPSDFVSGLVHEALFATQCAELTAEDRVVISEVLGRPCPDEEDTLRGIVDYRLKTQSRPSTCTFSTPGLEAGPSHGGHSEAISPPTEQVYATFASAKLAVPSAQLNASRPIHVAPLAPSRPGANALQAPQVAAGKPSAAKLAKPGNARQTTQTTLFSYAATKPVTGGASRTHTSKTAAATRPHGLRHGVVDDEATPEITLDSSGSYLPATGAKSHGPRPAGRTRRAEDKAMVKVSNTAQPQAQTFATARYPDPPAVAHNMKVPADDRSGYNIQNAPPAIVASAQTAGVKRRLGMTARFVGYSNKKFKPPTA